MKLSPRRLPGALLAGLLCIGLASCSMPPVLGLGGYYAVTDEATGKVYYTQKLSREERGAVEFLDPATGAWTSLGSAQVREISAAEFRAAQPL